MQTMNVPGGSVMKRTGGEDGLGRNRWGGTDGEEQLGEEEEKGDIGSKTMWMVHRRKPRSVDTKSKSSRTQSGYWCADRDTRPF